MNGMKEVGRLFNANELIVAEVLQSAEAMKAAVAHLEQFMEKKADSTKGKVILATVKGDVHDIGKNLVEIILSNNGYKIINLGIKVPPEDLIKAYREHKPDAIGLSGLLVKSAQQMVITAGDLKQAGITVPLLVGGAALSDKFTRNRIAPSYERVVIYCKDAMTGLAIMNKLMDPAERDKVAVDHQPVAVVAATEKDEVFPETTQRSSKVRLDVPLIPPPYPERKVRDVPQLREIWEYINPQMLYVRHLGFKSNFEKALAARDPKALELHNIVEDVKAEAAKFMKVKAVWQYFDAVADGNSIKLFTVQGSAFTVVHTFTFPRQRKPDGLCLSDYVLPPIVGQASSLPAVSASDIQRPQAGSSRYVRDSIALFVVGAGAGIRQRAEDFKAKGEYLKSHALQALAIETAEGCAEWLHRRIREDWGFPDPADMTMISRLQARYQGKRYSFGYPACPALEDQAGIWKLLKPEEIGVALTEGFMMDPEASVSALVFHHLDCTYFGVGDVAE
jgi:5-methyltetrahydrofolate--homocysteine methyltransferase